MGLKRLPDDFKDFLSSLHANKVVYLLLGGWAVGIYGHPRATADMDILIDISDANLDRLQKALREFGAPPVDETHFKVPDRVFRMGRSPVRIDIINSASGIDIRDCFSRKKEVTVDGVQIFLISREDLIANKKASGRDKDKADILVLEGIQDGEDRK